jgi:hypothetical protein
MDDLPGWLAIALSIITFCRQILSERKQSREISIASDLVFIANLIEKLDQIERQAFFYWTNPPNNDAFYSLMLSSAIKGFTDQIASAPKKFKDPLSPHVISFRKALTGGQFQQVNRTALTSADLQMKSMVRIIDRVRRTIVDCKN